MWRDDHQRAGTLGRLHRRREQPRARSRRQDQGLPLVAGRPLRRRQRPATVTIPRRSAQCRPADVDTESTARRAGGFCGSCYYWNVCRGGCTWVTHGLAGQARRQSVLPLPRARTGEEGPARAHREGRGGARRAVRFRTLRHRRGRHERTARARPSSRATTRSARADASSSSAPAATNSSSHRNASVRIAARRIGRSANPPRLIRARGAVARRRNRRACTAHSRACLRIGVAGRRAGRTVPLNSRRKTWRPTFVPTMPRSAMR